MPPDPIVEKTTILRNAEPLTMEAIPFAKGYRVKIKLSIDPANPMHLDRLNMAVERSEVRSAIKSFIDNIIVKDLQSKLIKDD